jgi:putative SOS response-associated peptidase YedK
MWNQIFDGNKGRIDLPFFCAQQKKRIFVFAGVIAPARTHTTTRGQVHFALTQDSPDD